VASDRPRGHVGEIDHLLSELDWDQDLIRLAIPWSQVRFALDSPLEGDGFELSVPRQKDNVFEAPQLDSAIPGEAIAHQMATA
jgi:hypothetical protein